jgi:hypothetical protein
MASKVLQPRGGGLHLWCRMDMQGDECSGVVAHALATVPRRTHKAPDLRRVIPLRPVPIHQECGEGSLRPSGIMATINLSLRSEGIQDRAYLSIGVTNSSGAGLCGVPGEVISGVLGRGYAGSCK